MSETLLAAVRALRVADPDLGLKPLLAKLREQQPDLGAATREVREAAAHYERAAALCPAPAVKAEFASIAGLCRSMCRGQGAGVKP
eukprot:scaffold80402_cov67-Phaeocystis_antarctica.AAC.2